MTTRRRVLQIGAYLAAGSVLPAAYAADSKPKTLLILGGTGFIGPHLTKEALRLGWRVTHFNRGKHSPDGVPDVETLIGDRKGQARLAARPQVGRGHRRHGPDSEVRQDVGRAAGA